MELLFILAFWLVLCALVAGYADSKGRGPGKAFLLAFVLSPLIAFIIVALLEDKKAAADREMAAEARHAEMLAAAKASAPGDPAPTASGDTRECPRCAEVIKAKAKVCRFCGAELEPMEVATGGMLHE